MNERAIIIVGGIAGALAGAAAGYMFFTPRGRRFRIKAERNLSAFMQEYLTVVRFSARAISGDREPLWRRLNAFWGLGKKSYEKLDLVGRALREHFRPRAN